MRTFVGTSPFFRSILCVATETMQFHIAQMSLFFRTVFFHIQVVSQNKLTPIRSFPDGTRLVQLAPRVLRNVCAVTFYRNKMYHIFRHGHYDIFILKQNNFLIIKVSFYLLLKKRVNCPNCAMNKTNI